MVRIGPYHSGKGRESNKAKPVFYFLSLEESLQKTTAFTTVEDFRGDYGKGFYQPTFIDQYLVLKENNRIHKLVVEVLQVLSDSSGNELF